MLQLTAGARRLLRLFRRHYSRALTPWSISYAASADDAGRRLMRRDK